MSLIRDPHLLLSYRSYNLYQKSRWSRLVTVQGLHWIIDLQLKMNYVYAELIRKKVLHHGLCKWIWALTSWKKKISENPTSSLLWEPLLAWKDVCKTRMANRRSWDILTDVCHKETMGQYWMILLTTQYLHHFDSKWYWATNFLIAGDWKAFFFLCPKVTTSDILL